MMQKTTRRTPAALASRLLALFLAGGLPAAGVAARANTPAPDAAQFDPFPLHTLKSLGLPVAPIPTVSTGSRATEEFLCTRSSAPAGSNTGSRPAM